MTKQTWIKIIKKVFVRPKEASSIFVPEKFLINTKRKILMWNFTYLSQNTSSSSSYIGCGAGDHKVSPCMTIISKCGNLLFLHCSFIIPKQSLYIIKVWSTWSTRSPFANGWNVQSISSSRLFLWHSEDVTKKFQLAVPNQMNHRHSVSHGTDGGVQNMVNALYIQHDSVAWGSKGVDFVFHILGDHPRFTVIE